MTVIKKKNIPCEPGIPTARLTDFFLASPFRSVAESIQMEIGHDFMWYKCYRKFVDTLPPFTESRLQTCRSLSPKKTIYLYSFTLWICVLNTASYSLKILKVKAIIVAMWG